MDEKDSNIHNNKDLETELREYEQADEKLAEKRASNDGNNNLEETITSTYKKLMIKTKLYDISMLLSSSRLFLAVAMDKFESSNSICDKYVQFWDPIYDNCYNIVCGFLYTNTGGYCEYRNITRKDLMELNQQQHYKTKKQENHQIKTCTMISLHDWEIW